MNMDIKLPVHNDYTQLCVKVRSAAAPSAWCSMILFLVQQNTNIKTNIKTKFELDLYIYIISIETIQWSTSTVFGYWGLFFMEKCHPHDWWRHSPTICSPDLILHFDSKVCWPIPNPTPNRTCLFYSFVWDNSTTSWDNLATQKNKYWVVLWTFKMLTIQ